MSININELSEYLKQNIPISQHMGVQVVDASLSQLSLSAPINLNVNHAEGAFGGSVSAIAILSAFLLLHIRTSHEGLNPHLVIQRNAIEYRKPITDTFIATSHLDDESSWEKFKKMYKRKGLARIRLSSVVSSNSKVCAEFSGDFVGSSI